MKPRTRVNLKPKTAVSKGCMYLSLMPPTSGVAFTCFVASVTAKSAKKVKETLELRVAGR